MKLDIVGSPQHLKVSGGLLTPVQTGLCLSIPGINTSAINPLTTIAESWIGPSSTTGIYFKAGNVGIGTTAPGARLEVVNLHSTAYVISTADGSVPDTSGLWINNNNVDAQSTGIQFRVDNSYVSAGDINYIKTRPGGVESAVDGAFTFRLRAGNTNVYERMRIQSDGNVGIGTTSPTAYLHLKAGTATANTAPIKINAGVVNTTPVSGCIESDGTHLYWVDSGGTRRQLDNSA